MKTSSFLSALRSQSALPLIFRAGDEIVSPGYHLTEVKRVAYETMDCGAMTHRWSESQFEIWVPEGADAAAARGHMAAQKFLRIVERVEAEVPLNGEATARIHASFADGPAALYDVERVEVRQGALWIELSPDRTRCKAAERRLASATGGCCGTSAGDAQETAAATSCGCTPAKAEATACCA